MNEGIGGPQLLHFEGGKIISDAHVRVAIAPNGDILTVNANDGKVVETTLAGIQVFAEDLDNTPAQGASNGASTLFGLAVAPDGGFYYVDDGTSMLDKVSATSQAMLGVASISPQAGSQVNGVAMLKFNPSEGKIDVTVDVAGLPPNSVHPAHIQMGNSCSANGPILYPFQSLKAGGRCGAREGHHSRTERPGDRLVRERTYGP